MRVHVYIAVVCVQRVGKGGGEVCVERERRGIFSKSTLENSKQCDLEINSLIGRHPRYGSDVRLCGHDTNIYN